MKRNTEFSIIVPVYNVEKYLKKCINSILNQTYINYELILVDDGSKDSSGKICDEYEKKDKRIKVVHKKNDGLSDARNKGLEIAIGDYIMFIDSDDYIDDNLFLDKLFNIISKRKSDIVIYGVKKEYESTGKFSNGIEIKSNVNESIIEYLVETNYYKASANNKVIKRDIIVKNKIKFPIGKLSEDIEWCSLILKYADLDRINYLNEQPYIYVQHSGSITKNVGIKNINDIFELIKNNCYENAKKYKEKIINNYLAYEYSVLIGLINTKNCKNVVSKKLKKEIFEYKWLLEFDMSNKVKKVKKVSKFMGINICSKILGIFIDFKTKI